MNQPNVVPDNSAAKPSAGGGLGSMDDLQGHPGNHHSPGGVMKARIAEPEEQRADTMKARRDCMPERTSGAPWWGYADKTSPWWAK